MSDSIAKYVTDIEGVSLQAFRVDTIGRMANRILSGQVKLQDYESTSMIQLDAPSDWRPGGRGFNPLRGRQHSFVKIDHKMFSTVIFSLLLI